MNLYDFSQQNNNEMGILISKAQDPELYNAALDEAHRLLTISNEIRVTVKMVPPSQGKNEKKQIEIKAAETTAKKNGYCIRTRSEIPFNVEKPLSYDAYKKWSEFGDEDYPEKFCHFSGESSNGETSVSKPILKKNWKKAKEVFDL